MKVFYFEKIIKKFFYNMYIIEMYFCTNCSSNFANKQNYQTHLLSKKHARMNDNNYSCKCGKIFSCRQTLHVHKKKCDLSSNCLEYCKHLEDENARMSKMLPQNVHTNTVGTQTDEEYQLSNDVCRKKITPKRRSIIYEYQNGLCKNCSIELPTFFHIDHIIALRFGGTNEDDNLQAICANCHNSKTILENKHESEIRRAISDIIKKYETDLQN